MFVWAIILVLFWLPKLRYIFGKQSSKRTCLWDGSSLNWFQRLVFHSIGDFIEYWHQYEVHGIDNLQKLDHCLLVGYHSRCTVDILYILCYLQPNLLVSYLFFKVPLLGSVIHYLNMIPSKGDNAEMGFVTALAAGKRPLLLLPGGAFEFLKRHAQISTVQWKPIPGFARVICEEPMLQGKVKVVPYYTKNCERCYFTTKWWYDTLGAWSAQTYTMMKRGNVLVMPIMMTVMLLSIGFNFVPSTVKLDTYFGEPLSLKEGESAASFARRITDATQSLVDRVEAIPPSRGDKKTKGSIWKLMEFLMVMIYTFCQNTLLNALSLTLIWLPWVSAVYGLFILRDLFFSWYYG